MAKYLITALMAALLGATPLTTAFAQISGPSDPTPGTGVAGGGPGEREQRINSIRAKFEARFGQDVKSLREKNATEEQISSWCGLASSVLKLQLRIAKNRIAKNDFDGAFTVLFDTLDALSQQIEVDDGSVGPITKTMIDRGLLLAAAVKDSLKNPKLGSRGNTVFNSATQLNYILEYVQFIIDISNDLDSEFYVPYRYRICRHNDPDEYRNFNLQTFERKYLEFAKRQLDFVTADGRFTQVVPVDGSRRVLPIGSPKAFLKAAELSAKFVAIDLSENLFAPRFRCQIADLRELVDVLVQFNDAGLRDVYSSEMEALNSVRGDLVSIADSVISGLSCGPNCSRNRCHCDHRERNSDGCR